MCLKKFPIVLLVIGVCDGKAVWSSSLIMLKKNGTKTSLEKRRPINTGVKDLKVRLDSSERLDLKL